MIDVRAVNTVESIALRSIRLSPSPPMISMLVNDEVVSVVGMLE